LVRQVLVETLAHKDLTELQDLREKEVRQDLKEIKGIQEKQVLKVRLAQQDQQVQTLK
jgi:hypothetical protein